MYGKWLIPLVSIALLPSLPAVAAPIVATYTIAASGFTDILGGTVPPTDPVRLDVSISFDPAAGDQFDYGTGIALRGNSVAVGGPIAYDYDSANDILTVGGIGLSTFITAGTNDVLAEIDGVRTGRPSFGGLEYTTARTSGVFLSVTGSVSVPEPGTVAVMLGGLAGLLARRRRV